MSKKDENPNKLFKQPSPQIVLRIAIVAGLGGPSVTTADVGDDSLGIGRHGDGAVAHAVVASTVEVTDDVLLDGKLDVVGHVVEEVDHTDADANELVITVVLTTVLLY